MELNLSVIIPLFNEEESVKELHQKIQDVIDRHELGPYEILFINDGSNDGSLDILKSIQLEDSNVRIISFLKNYGKAAALSVGFAECKGKYVVTMDADLQDDPEEIIRFIELSKEKNLDLISGWKKERRDPIEKKIPSKFFNFVTSTVGGIRLHDFNCGLKFYRQAVVKSLSHLVYGEMHRFIPLLAYWHGFAVGEMVVKHHPRKHGESKYGFARYLHGFMDLLTLALLNRYRTRPMHVFGLFGLLTFLVGISINLYFLVVWIQTQTLHVRPIMLLGVIMMVVSLQFFSLGFISEMITQNNSKNTVYRFEEITPPDGK